MLIIDYFYFQLKKPPVTDGRFDIIMQSLKIGNIC